MLLLKIFLFLVSTFVILLLIAVGKDNRRARKEAGVRKEAKGPVGWSSFSRGRD